MTATPQRGEATTAKHTASPAAASGAADIWEAAKVHEMTATAQRGGNNNGETHSQPRGGGGAADICEAARFTSAMVAAMVFAPR